MSLVQAWFFGSVAFLAMTLSLVLAFSIAITGPPSDQEIDGIEAALGRASRQVAVITRELGDEACRQVPPEASTGLCPAQTVAVEETPPPALDEIEETPEPPAAEELGAFEGEDGALAQDSVGGPDLLGGAERAAPPQSRAEAPRPERRRAVARAERRPPPVADAEDGSMVAMRARADLALAAPEEEAGPRQAARAGYARDDERYDREQSAAEEEGYYDEYEARRARWRERRRARRERRYYGGW